MARAVHSCFRKGSIMRPTRWKSSVILRHSGRQVLNSLSSAVSIVPIALSSPFGFALDPLLKYGAYQL